MNLFTTREIAVGIWICILSIGILRYKPFRDKAFEIVSGALKWRSPFFTAILYVVVITFVFLQTAIWEKMYIKDAVLWIIFVEVPLYFRWSSRNREKYSFRKEVVSVFKLTVLVCCATSTLTFPWLLEVVVVPMAAGILLIDVVLATDNEYRPAKWLVRGVIAVLLIMLVYEMIFVRGANVSVIGYVDIFVLLGYSILFMPVLYMIEVVDRYGKIFLLMKNKERKREKVRNIQHRWKIIRICLCSLYRLEKMEKECVPLLDTKMEEEEFDKIVTEIKYKVPLASEVAKEEQYVINQIREANFRKKIEYISNHVGSFTLLSTLLVGLGTMLFKGFVFAYRCGKLDYWGINHIYINITNENLLYEIVLYAAIFILYFAVCSVPNMLIKSKQRWYVKVSTFMGYIVCLCVLTYFLIYGSGTRITIDMLKERRIIIMMFIAMIMLFGPGISAVFMMNSGEEESGKINFWHKLVKPVLLFGLLILGAVYIALFYFLGWSVANEQKEYKVVGDKAVVIFENEDCFILSECEIGGERITIYYTMQQVTNKENIVTKIMSFQEVIKGMEADVQSRNVENAQEYTNKIMQKYN